MTESERLSRKLTVMVAAFAAGLILMFAGVAVFDSRWLVGVALLILIGVGAFTYHWFRCPFCGNPMLQYSLKELRPWIQSGPKLCPFCAGDLGSLEAPAEPATSA
jgi:hypothetical protein